MAENEIISYGNEVLRRKAEEVAEFDDEVRNLLSHMYEVMAENKGLGLAAPQIGISKRIFVYDIGEGPHALINPEIVGSKGEISSVEGCLSIPGLQGEVPRAQRVIVTGLNEEGKRVKIKADGLMARVFQHEIDHLNGTMFVDRADPDTLEIISQSDEEEED
jgi:peptide deformylase